MAMARMLGRAIIDNGLDLVYGGVDVGLMGEVADTVLGGDREVIGIIPKSFAHKVSHRGLTELRVVDSMHERKAMMFVIIARSRLHFSQMGNDGACHQRPCRHWIFAPFRSIWPEPAKSYWQSGNAIFSGDFAVNCEIDGKSTKV